MRTTCLALSLAVGLAVGGCSDTSPPTWPPDAQLSAVRIEAHQVELTWPAASDDRTLTGYQLLAGQRQVADLAADQTVHLVDGLADTSAFRFSLIARDEAGNRSRPLELEVTTADDTPPVWPDQAVAAIELLEPDQESARFVLSWPAASDNLAVSGYRIVSGKVAERELGAEVMQTEWQASELPSDPVVLAADAAGNTSAPLRPDPERLRELRTGLRRAALQKQIAESGLLKILGAHSSQDRLANLFGDAEQGSGLDSAFGGLSGSAIGEAYGTGGLGTRGSGGGGGAIGSLAGLGRAEPQPKRKGRVELSSVVVSGPVSDNLARQTVERRLGALKACYEKRLQEAPGLEGSLKLGLSLASGRVERTQVLDGSLTDPIVRACITRVLRGLRIPEASGGLLVELHLQPD